MVATRTGFELQSGANPQDSETPPRDSTEYRFQYDQSTTPPSMAVVTALSEVMDADPTTLDPLQETIDTDALDAFAACGETGESAAQITWTQEGYTVTVHNHGEITIAPVGGNRTEAIS
mgnify:CR=1 FL=1